MDLPDFLTVEEAARVLRIGRTSAYALAARYEETNGAEGLPVVRFGRLLRVPRAALEAHAGGPITCVPRPCATIPSTLPPSTSVPTTAPVGAQQLAFPSTAA